MFPFNFEQPTRRLLLKTYSENFSTTLIKIIKIYFAGGFILPVE